MAEKVVIHGFCMNDVEKIFTLYRGEIPRVASVWRDEVRESEDDSWYWVEFALEFQSESHATNVLGWLADN